jgi:glycosyltransferase involved in cell wall biosynthesis
VHPVKDLVALQKLTRQFRRHRPDIVHTHSGKAGVIGRLAAARAGVPVIVHTIHGPSFGAFQGSIANVVFTAAERAASRVTSHFITVADAMTSQYLGAGIGRRDQFTTIRSGFDLEPFLLAPNDPAMRSRFGFKPHDIVVGKIARLFALKGHDDLLNVAPGLIRKEPRLKFLLIGDGPWRERLETRARDAGIANHVRFAGLVPPLEVPRCIGIMDFLVHLSLREGLARALPQALAAAKPVVAYDVDGAREICLDARTGYLIRAGDRDKLEDAILKLAADPALRARLGAAGQTMVRNQFPTQRMVDAIYDLYVQLLKGKEEE